MTTSTQPIVAARYSSTAGQSIANATTAIVNFATRTHDTHNAVTVGASWKFTSPKSSFFVISSNLKFANSLSWTANGGLSINIYKNGVIYSNSGISNQAVNSSATGASTNIIGTIYLNKGDYVDIRVSHGESSGRALNTTGTSVYIDIMEGTYNSQDVGNMLKSYAKYTSSSTIAVPVVGTVFDFATKVYDSHNLVTVGAAWKFIADRVMIVRVSSSLNFTGPGLLTNPDYTISIRKNGTVVTTNTSRTTSGATGSSQANTIIELVRGDYVDVVHGESANGGTYAGTHEISIETI